MKVTGTYDQTKEVAADFAARHGTYLDGGAKAIPGKESMKTIAFEIADRSERVRRDRTYAEIPQTRRRR